MTGDILLVDDDPMIRTVVADNLSDFDLSVHVAASEAQAIARLRANPDISVAIVDYCLPRPVGIDLCRQITATFPHVAVALYTGHEELANVRRGEDEIPVLSKSMRIEQLVTAIRDLGEGRAPQISAPDLTSRAELLWRQESRRETVRAVSKAVHNQFDRTLQEPLPGALAATLQRMSGRGKR